MRKVFLIGGIVALLLILFFSTLNGSVVTEKENGLKQDRQEEEAPENNVETAEAVAHSTINEMTLDEKIGQLIIGSVEGDSVNSEVIELIQTYKIGGFILFSPNLQTPHQSITLINKLKVENRMNKIPLLLSVDQEGGDVTRLPHIDELKTNEEIGEIKNEETAYKTGRLLANQLKAFGLQMNFAPVLDVNNNPQNPVIGNRSYGKDSEIVSKLGTQTMRGIQDGQIIPVIKHFPGHGDTHIDSHEELPVIDKRVEELEQMELIPFRTAIQAGADVVMTAHILLPKVDEKFPVTLSPLIISGVLRDRLGFDGVIVTDDLTMGAISNNYDIGEAAVQAIKAGVDIVLVAHHYENVTKVFQAMKEAVHSGKIDEERVNESVERILILKEKYEVNDETIEEVDIEKLNEEIAELYGQ